MKAVGLLLVIAICNCYLFSQQETFNWAVGQNVKLDFSSGNPAHSYNLNCFFWESSASVSDENGNLLFFTDGDTIKGNNNQVLPNGTNLSSAHGPFVNSVTQGSLFLKKPNSNSIYYLFSMGFFNNGHIMNLSYSVIDKTLNGGLGDVISKNNLLVKDSLTEKMTATKHCNNKDYWLVVVNKKLLLPGEANLDKYNSEFLSFLITENGVQLAPKRSIVNIAVPHLGQIKFNSDGTLLACADNQGISLFNFDKGTGQVSLQRRINVYLGNGYGLEFSPDDRFIYINEKQYDLVSDILTPLMGYDCPSQLQRASDGKLYKMHMPDSEISISSSINNSAVIGNSNSSFRLSRINQPNVQGTGCLFDTTFIYDFHNNYTGWSLALPHFPSFHFYHPSSEFTYNGTCSGESFQFHLVNATTTLDSVHWIFDDTHVISGLTASYVFSESGTWQVSCITFNNGIGDTTSQCITVCGINDVSLPSIINLCKTDALEVNAINPCSYKYLWNTGDTTAALQINEVGLYILETTSACGVFYDTITALKQGCDALTEIPNVFTPNADGVNDVFSIDLKNVASFNYQIFNRWGNVIKDSNIVVSPANVFNWNTFTLWNGESQGGKEVSEGVYFYLIRLETITGEQSTKQGFIQLLK